MSLAQARAAMEVKAATLAREYPVSARTPEQAFPAYSITWNRRRRFPEPPADWALEVGGLVRKPVRLTLPMLRAMPSVTYTVERLSST